MCALVATLRRVPGGGFIKAPKSLFMVAVPYQTTFQNFETYFTNWPKRQSQFLLYGSGKPYSSLARDISAGGTSNTSNHSKIGKSGGTLDGEHDDVHLYGPDLEGPPVHQAVTAAEELSRPSPPSTPNAKPIGLAGVLRRFQRGQKLTMVTGYDFPSARFARCSGAELLLVGDSLGNCRLGLQDTVGVTMEDMLRATAAVRRGVDAPPHKWSTSGLGPKPVVVGDMPFGSYLVDTDALKNAAAFRVAGADMVKLEGGRQVAHFIRKLTDAGIAVMAHIGLEPQRALLQGGLKQQGVTASAALEIVRDAEAVVAAGAVAVVIECVPAEVGHAVQAAVPLVPIIGIGAGGDVAGQVLVCDDMLGMHGSPPSFAKQYVDVGAAAATAYASFVSEVRSGVFPAAQHTRHMRPDERAMLLEFLPAAGIGAACQADVSLEVSADASKVSQVVQQQDMPSKSTVITSAAARMITTNIVPELSNGNFAKGARTISHMAQGGDAVGDYALKVLHTCEDVQAWRRSVGRVALVPTMGNLHEGHLELVDEAQKHADAVVVSIFVNPSQFAAHEDFGQYPRTFERDMSLLKERGVAAVFAPAPSEIYPTGSPGGVLVVPSFVQGKSEDAIRPHFFTGVATVCLKLFNLCQPDVVVFGQKDAMQCAVIERMLQDLLLDTRISLVVAPTSRESDGLARSSRNSYLTPTMRSVAPFIHAALKDAVRTAGATPESVRTDVRMSLEGVGMEVEYVSVADRREMCEKDAKAPLADSIVSIASILTEGEQRCRLIDNVVIPANLNGAAA